MMRKTLARCGCAALAAAACTLASANGATPAELLAGYVAQAGAPASPERGRQLFTTVQKNTFDWSCSSCHGPVPTGQGRHDLSHKPIAPLAPAANPSRFTDAKRVEGWFRTNCTDVVGRDCSAQEKADVLSWLISLRP
jgi:hypothetical protein